MGPPRTSPERRNFPGRQVVRDVGWLFHPENVWESGVPVVVTAASASILAARRGVATPAAPPTDSGLMLASSSGCIRRYVPSPGPLVQELPVWPKGEVAGITEGEVRRTVSFTQTGYMLPAGDASGIIVMAVPIHYKH